MLLKSVVGVAVVLALAAGGTYFVYNLNEPCSGSQCGSAVSSSCCDVAAPSCCQESAVVAEDADCSACPKDASVKVKAGTCCESAAEVKE